MQKIKEFIKKYMIGLTLSFLICISVVSAVTYFNSKNITYDNSTTGMSSTNVQDAVDELYSACFPSTPSGDQILENVEIVTSGDGLYKDEYEEGRYIYKGTNPNNYITFNNETWRIISIESDKTIKIMREESIGNRPWDNGDVHWTLPVSINLYLNGDYYNNLAELSKKQIITKNFNIGSVIHGETDLSKTIKEEKGATWKGNVALITASEYIRSNSNQSDCGTMQKLHTPTTCKNTTWMYNQNLNWWTLTAQTNSGGIYVIYYDGKLSPYYPTLSYSVRPSVYLSSEIQITGGDGSQSNPYTLG